MNEADLFIQDVLKWSVGRKLWLQLQPMNVPHGGDIALIIGARGVGDRFYFDALPHMKQHVI